MGVSGGVMLEGVEGEGNRIELEVKIMQIGRVADR